MVEKHFDDISGALPIFGDIITGGKSEEEHDLILRKVLTRARERNVKFNRDKIQFCVNQFKHMDESSRASANLTVLVPSLAFRMPSLN